MNGTLNLTGSGFAEGATTVQFGNLVGRQRTLQRTGCLRRQQSEQRPTFVTSGGINLTVPSGVPTGPIRVTTIGGTSQAFGLTFTGIVGTAGSGTPADAGKASANPGQTITIQGTNLDATTDVVFLTSDSAGNRRELVVRPAVVAADKTSAQVDVPNGAVTGVVRVVGDTTATAVLLRSYRL